MKFWWSTIKDLRAENARITVKASEFLQESYAEQYAKRMAAARAKELETELEHARSMGKILAEENRELARQLELYRAVISQLSIPIKLPVRKTND